MGRPAKAGFEILMSYENWLLVKNGELKYSATEIDGLPISMIQHFIGFDIGQGIKDKAEQEAEMRRSKARSRK